MSISARSGVSDQGSVGELVGEGLVPAQGQEGHPQGAPLQDFIEISVTDTGEGIPPKNIKKLFQPLLTALVLAFLVLTGHAMAGQTTSTNLVFAGSGTNLPIIRVLARAFQKSKPGITIDVPSSIGSTSAVRAVADRAIAIGLISRPLKNKETGMGLEVVHFARTPMIIGTHASVKDGEITFAGLVDIYRKKTTWKDGREIIVLTREPGDSSVEMLADKVPGFREAYEESLKAKRWTVLFWDLEMNEALAKTPAAIGLTDLGTITTERHRIKPLRVNGVAPTLKNLRNGTYPLYKTLSFVYRKDAVPPEAREFIAFVKSGAGKKILVDNGYLPEQ